jgi:hypothetical protein
MQMPTHSDRQATEVRPQLDQFVYRVEVKSFLRRSQVCSTHTSYRDAIQHAEEVGGVIIIHRGKKRRRDRDAYWWACCYQGFVGEYEDWKELDDSVRNEYERTATGRSAY